MQFQNYTKLNPVQKTIRFELRPVGKSLDNLVKSDLLDRDRKLSECYPIMKGMIDDYHRGFIDETLNKVNLDWSDLGNAIDANRSSNDGNREKNKKELERIKQNYRDDIFEKFKSDDRFSKLGTEKLFSELMAGSVESSGTEEQKEAFRTFNGFSGYFIGLHENRMNLYDKGPKSTAIAFRLVDQNFPRFYQNLKTFEKIKVVCPEVIAEIQRNMGNIERFFSLEGYNSLLNQRGIDEYNEIIGGVALSEKEHIVGLNQMLNEYHQRNPDSERFRLQNLYKLMLNDRGTSSFIPTAFESDSEVCAAVAAYVQSLNDQHLLEKISDLFINPSNYDCSGIFVSSSALPHISTTLYGKWDILGEVLRKYFADKLGDPNMIKTAKKVEKMLSSKMFPLSLINEAIYLDNPVLDVNIMRAVSDSAESAQRGLGNVKQLSTLSNVRTDEGSKVIRDILEPMIDLVRDMKSFLVSTEEKRDEAFYQEFDYLYDQLFAVIRLYNRVRNYCTKKEYDTDKMKMNFGNPTLANGWSVSKERDNTCVLFRKDERFYIGIMNPAKKTDFTKIRCDPKPDSYEKMDYYYLTDATKMLPKVFKSEKWRRSHTIPEDIEAIFEARSEGKIDNDPEGSDVKLISYYQDCIRQHHEWDVFDFQMKPPLQYEGLNDFFDSLTKQGYKLSFRPIDSEIIDRMVDEGALFLFMLYNKDFSSSSASMKDPSRANLHTIYWKAAFSEENLRDVVIKLNGEAELFYRKKSDYIPTIHKKGDIILRRTDENGVPIPEKIFSEIFRHVTHPDYQLSDEAKRYLPIANPRPAPHDIQKDKRYTVDKMFLHVSLTFNYRCDNMSLKMRNDLNERILMDAATSENRFIIGIDRGERNLLYMCLIDGSGKIVLQKSLNTIGEYDYRSKLDDREKERQEDRRNWGAVRNISNLKEGYISRAVHEIVKLAVEYNALIVMEDLNIGFKRGRYKIEKQVYQKFESMLLDKLNHLVFKHTPAMEPGGVLNAYQLCPPFESFSKLGKQSGIVLYVPAAYTSQIDPVTGFVDVFSKGSDTISNKRDFLSRMDSIAYDPAQDCFSFAFDYRKFPTTQTMFRTQWTVYTRGERILYSKKEKRYETVKPTNVLKDSLALNGIDLGGELKNKIISDDRLVKAAYRAFELSLKMRNSDETRDFIMSPVLENSRFYCSDDWEGEKARLPVDADANGAYNIARKGMLILKKCKEQYDPESGTFGKVRLNISNEGWLKYVQGGERWSRCFRYPTSTISCSVPCRYTIII